MNQRKKCFECGAPILDTDRTWMRGAEDRFFHPRCFPEYLKAENKRRHRGLPARLYADVSEVLEERPKP